MKRTLLAIWFLLMGVFCYEPAPEATMREPSLREEDTHMVVGGGKATPTPTPTAEPTPTPTQSPTPSMSPTPTPTAEPTPTPTESPEPTPTPEGGSRPSRLQGGFRGTVGGFRSPPVPYFIIPPVRGDK